MRKCKESDWRAFKELSPVAIDRYAERVLGASRGILDDPSRSPMERLEALDRLTLEARRRIARDFPALARSDVLPQVAVMHAEGLLEPEELARFSDEIRESLAELERIRQRLQG